LFVPVVHLTEKDHRTNATSHSAITDLHSAIVIHVTQRNGTFRHSKYWGAM